MLDFLRDKLAALRLKARHELRLQEQLLALTESAVPEDNDGQWHAVGEVGQSMTDGERQDHTSQLVSFWQCDSCR